MDSNSQIQEDAYQDDLGFATGQLGKGGGTGPVRGPTVDKKTQVSISKRLQVGVFYAAWFQTNKDQWRMQKGGRAKERQRVQSACRNFTNG